MMRDLAQAKPGDVVLCTAAATTRPARSRPGAMEVDRRAVVDRGLLPLIDSPISASAPGLEEDAPSRCATS